MKKIFIAFAILFLVNQSFAQWVSPGNGQSYTLETLCVAAPSAVQTNASGNYVISQNLTLSAGDLLTLESSATIVTVNDGITLTISGTLQTAARSQILVFQGDSAQNNYFEFRFEDASQNNLSNVHFRYCQGIKLISSNMTIDSCEFDHFSNHVISYMNCNPVIQNSYFHDNQVCAIQSAINADGCPKILNNVFYNNVLANTNNPQINIGPGTTDTILIIGNRIEGVASTMSGGIGIMNMSNPAVTKVLLKDNVITNNRYGYTQNGYRISSEIFDNQFIDNNLEVTPNNGGSGISVYGYDTTCAAKLRRNLITGNLWGVTAIYYHHVDMGTAEDPGYNVLYNNGNGGVDYELYNNAFSNMNAVGNYWGCDNATAAEDVIFHQADNPSYGLVNYLPIYVIEPEILSFDFLLENNPGLAYPDYYNNLYGNITEGDTILFHITGCVLPDLSNLKPTIVRPLGVSVSPSEDEGQNFWLNPIIIYTASTPHQTFREYVVHFIIEAGVPENALTKINLAPNPVTQGFFTMENPTEVNLNWQIFTSTGQCVMFGEAQPGTNRIVTKGLKSGTYLVNIQKDNTFVTRKLIVR